MSEKTLDGLLERADAFARSGDWQGAFDCLLEVVEIQPQHIGALTGLGTCLLQMGQVEQSIPYFRKVVELVPEVPDAHNNLGVALTLIREYQDAEKAYQQAIRLNPDHLPAWKNLAQIYLQQEERITEGAQILAALVQVNPKDVDVLLMLAGCYEKAEDVESARTLLREVLKIQPKHPEALAIWKRINGNSSELIRVARPEHAQKLATLKQKMLEGAAVVNAVKEPSASSMNKNKVMRVAFYAPQALSSSYQMEILSQTLGNHGWKTKFAHKMDEEEVASYDCCIFCQPNLSSELIQGIQYCLRRGKPYFVYLSEDFHHLPKSHPAYHHFGPGNPNALKALEIILDEALCLITPSNVLAERYKNYAKRVEVVPPSWSNRNPLWGKSSPKHSTFNLGWIGSAGDRDDLMSIKKAIVKLMNVQKQTFLVIAGDPMAYEMFPEIPERRRIFLPLYQYEDIPYVLSHFDLLLVPLRQNEYNQARSDLALMEAGVRGIPWLASPVPAFEDWGVGGKIVRSFDEWLPAIQSLMSDEELRKQFGQEGMAKGQAREIEHLIEKWFSVLVSWMDATVPVQAS